jgi:ParB family transcriptional regulator, chromosome partitioning protein
MQFECRTVSIDSIDLENETFKISMPQPMDELIYSINQFSLLSPPIIKSSSHGYIVVSGFKRVNACKKLGWINIEARVIASEIKDIDCLKIAMADNTYNRKMNLVEQSIALFKLASLYDDKKEFINIAKVFGFSDNLSYINKLLMLHTLIPELQQSILSCAIPMSIALEIAKFDKESMHHIVQIFENLRPTLNQQREMLSLIREISKIKNISIENLFKEKNIQDLLNHPELTRNMKIKNLRSYLKKMRYPSISTYYDHFHDLIHRLALPNKIKLTPPENFEDVCYSILLSFDSPSEFESHLEVLKNLSGTPEFKSIFSNESATQ